MIAMSLIARLPAAGGLAVGVALLFLYPLVVPATAEATGAVAVIRTLAIAPGQIPGTPVLAFYSFVPWLAVMCLGFGLGPVFRLERGPRDKRLLGVALGLLAAFLILRGLDGYGDPAPWAHLATGEQTIMSFLNVSKYPPSPDYVLATLGVAMLLFLGLEHLRGGLATVLLAYGRTPLFTYLCHLYIAHGLMLAVMLAMGLPASGSGHFVEATKPIPGWGFSLPVAYLVWLTVLVLLYPLARWFAGVKRRRRDWWLGYL